MSENLMPEQQLHVAPEALQALERDRALALDHVQPGEAVVAHPDQLQTVSVVGDYITGSPSQELKGVINAAGQNYNLVDTMIHGRHLRMLTRSSANHDADLVGFVGQEGLTVHGHSKHEQARPLFRLAYDEHGNLRVENLDNMPLSVAIKSQEQAEPAAEQPVPTRFSPRSLFRGLVRAIRGVDKTPQEKTYTQGIQWARRYSYVKKDYAAQRGETIVNTEILGREVQMAQSPEAQRFWEQGHAKDASTFAEQVREAATNPEAFKGTVTSAPDAVMSPTIRRAKVEFSEAEGVKNLNDFLDSVAAVAERSGDPHMAQEVANFKEKFHFLSAEEYQEACRGIAKMWFEYVKQSPDHILNVFHNPRGGEHSYTEVLQNVMNEFHELAGGLTLASRVQTTPEMWQTGYHSKLVVVDDWLVSGTVVKSLLAKAAEAARAANKADLVNGLEAHVLISRKGQTEDPTWSIGADDDASDQFKVRSYYETTQAAGAYEAVPSGSHSSVDYGFGSRLGWMRDYAMRHGEDLGVPLLTELARTYRAPDQLMLSDPQQRQILERTAVVNAQIADAQYRAVQLEREHARLHTRAVTGPGITEERSIAYAKLVNVRTVLLALNDQQFALANAYQQRRLQLEG